MSGPQIMQGELPAAKRRVAVIASRFNEFGGLAEARDPRTAREVRVDAVGRLVHELGEHGQLRQTERPR